MSTYYTLTQTATSFTVVSTFPEEENVKYKLDLVIKKVDCYGNKQTIATKTILAGSETDNFTYTFNVYGKYEVKIEVFRIAEKVEEENLTFFNNSLHTNLLNSTVDNILSLFCGCNCQDCGDDCGKKDSDYSTVLNKLLSLNIIKDNYYTEAITQTNSCIKCDIEQGVDCELLQEKITGSSDNKEKIKKLIAYYYLVYYHKDLLESETPDEVTKQYKYNDIYKCIKHLGLDINCIKTKII